ncbi:hypothetical protein [Candidatus Berkiella aquae]|uniref:Uncharacterized protein n=1 Tax=Candidatus Berkiella aquae TaxID=295108 RepID=A0A0Q9YL19_9GAMM|nr:hypothetical protein [Candidatus Berkiella aquae]MCS5710966.1 hypothetical protein [Candidatus Berkiella aquae]
MRELQTTELLFIHGGDGYSNWDVLGFTSGGAALAGLLGYYMSYNIFSLAEGLLFLSASVIPTTTATWLILGSIELFHSFYGNESVSSQPLT